MSADYRSLTMADGPAVLAVMKAASGGLGRLPEEMDLAWVAESLGGALAGGVALGAWADGRLAGVIKAPRMPSVQFQEATLSRTFGSLATIEIGTSRLALSPLTRATGWWSPRKTMTVSSVP